MAVAKKTDTPVEDTFTFTLPDGSTANVGRPRGVLKLRLREVLSSDLLKDAEIVAIASAFMSIRDINGLPVILRTYSEFTAIMNRFGSDDTLEEFMNEYQKFTDPQGAAIIEEVIAQAAADHLKPDELQDLLTSRLMAHKLSKRGSVKN